MDSRKRMGTRIRELRKQKDNMTQAQLAKLAGISINSLRLYEGGKISPKYETVIAIANALEVDPLEIADDVGLAGKILDEQTKLPREMLGNRYSFLIDVWNKLDDYKQGHAIDCMWSFVEMNHEGVHESAVVIKRFSHVPEFKEPTEDK